MPRKGPAPRRELIPDPVHRSVLVTQVINKILSRGKRSLAERIVFFSQPDDRGWVRLFPVQRRAGFADGSAADGWLHPAVPVTDDHDCPCGSEQAYSACHRAALAAGGYPAASLTREAPTHRRNHRPRPTRR